MNTRNNTRAKNTRKKIEQSFLTLLKQYKLSEITVSMITDYANINRCSFYIHYNDMYDLINQIEFKMIENLSTQLKNDSQNYTTDTEKYLLPYLKYISMNQDFFLLFYTHSSNYKHGKQLQEILYSSIRKYIDKNIVNDNRILDYCLEYYETGLFMIIKKWLINSCIETPEEMVKIINVCTHHTFLNYNKA